MADFFGRAEIAVSHATRLTEFIQFLQAVRNPRGKILVVTKHRQFHRRPRDFRFHFPAPPALRGLKVGGNPSAVKELYYHIVIQSRARFTFLQSALSLGILKPHLFRYRTSNPPRATPGLDASRQLRRELPAQGLRSFSGHKSRQPPNRLALAGNLKLRWRARSPQKRALPLFSRQT